MTLLAAVDRGKLLLPKLDQLAQLPCVHSDGARARILSGHSLLHRLISDGLSNCWVKIVG
jgi:hypothetical protein